MNNTPFYTWLRNNAQRIDQDTDGLQTAIQRFITDGDFTHATGMLDKQSSMIDIYLFLEKLTSYSGALSFIFAQHITACAFVAKSENTKLHDKYLADFLSGNKLSGVGFSHLRNSDPTLALATKTDTGYTITGKVPWFTGWNYFSYGAIAARIKGDESHVVFVLVTLDDKLNASKPLALASMQVTNTVTLNLNNYAIKQDQVISIKAVDDIVNIADTRIKAHPFFCIGNATGAIQCARNTAKIKKFQH